MHNYFYPYYFPNYVVPVNIDGNSNNQQNLVISLIEQAIIGEREDELFYDYLISVAPTQQEKKVIESIRDDERKHRRMFRNIYAGLTGRSSVVSEEGGGFQRPSSYLEGLERALMGELKAFDKYRTIYLNITPQYRDMIFEIMTDEIKHASYYNWLYSKNK